MPSIRVRSTSAVPLPDTAAAPEPVALSPFDALWVALPPPLNLYVFKSPPAKPPFPAIVESLKRSLTGALATFHPFAGELTYQASSRSVLIDASGGAGVAFVEAETDLDFQGFVDAEELDAEALLQLVPNIRRDTLPAPAMAVQVTEFLDGGGLAVGLALHHSVADGRGRLHFMDAWAAAARGSSSPKPVTPAHDRSLVRFDGDEEFVASIMRQTAPNLPRLVAPRQQGSGTEHHRRRHVPVTPQSFTIPAAAVNRLKQQLATANGGQPPSTFTAVTAHRLVSFSRAGVFDDDDPVVMSFVAGIRAHMSPPVDRAYTGNCIAFCVASLRGSDLAAPDGLARALAAIRTTVESVKANPLKDRDGWVPRFAAFPPGRSLVVSGSPWFPSFEMDLGFGTPVRAERAGMGRDGQAYLTAGYAGVPPGVYDG